MKVLHIVATPRSSESNSLRVSTAFLETLISNKDDLEVETVDLFDADLPAIAGDNIEAKYTLMVGKPIDQAHAESWGQIEALIERFLAADLYLLTVPMWNLSIPYALKYYIDCIIQPGYTFTYNAQGQVVPLVNGKRMVVCTSRGGDYSAESPAHVFDHQEPYLRAIFGFVGVGDIEFVSAQPMDVSPELRERATATAVEQARKLAINY